MDTRTNSAIKLSPDISWVIGEATIVIASPGVREVTVKPGNIKVADWVLIVLNVRVAPTPSASYGVPLTYAVKYSVSVVGERAQSVEMRIYVST